MNIRRLIPVLQKYLLHKTYVIRPPYTYGGQYAIPILAKIVAVETNEPGTHLYITLATNYSSKSLYTSKQWEISKFLQRYFAIHLPRTTYVFIDQTFEQITDSEWVI
jgi:hypothetical protein